MNEIGILLWDDRKGKIVRVPLCIIHSHYNIMSSKVSLSESLIS